MSNNPEIKKVESVVKNVMPEKAAEIVHKYENVSMELSSKISDGLMANRDVAPLVQASDYLKVSKDTLLRESERGSKKENLKQMVVSFESELDSINASLLAAPEAVLRATTKTPEEKFEEKLPTNLRGKGFYEENGKLKRKGKEGEYTLLADGTLAYFGKTKGDLRKSYPDIDKIENLAYLNGGTYQFLKPYGDIEKDWSSHPVHGLNGFYLENGKIKRKGKEGNYELMADGTLIYYYPNNGGFAKLEPGKDLNTGWNYNEEALIALGRGKLGLKGDAETSADPEFEALMDLFTPEQQEEMIRVLNEAQLSIQSKINNRLLQISLLTEAFKGAALNIARDNGRKTAFEQLYQFFYEFDETTQKRIKDLEGAIADLEKVAIEVVKNPGDSLNELYSQRVLALMKQYDLDGDDYNFMNRSGEVVDAGSSHDTLQRQTLSTVDYLIKIKRYEQAANLIAGTMLFPHFQKAGEYFGGNQQKIKWAVEEGAPPFDSLSGVEKQALQRFKKLQGIGELSPAQWDKIIDGTIEALPYMLGAGLAAGVGRKVLGEGAKWVVGNWLTRYGLSVSTEFLAGEVMATSNLGRIIYFAGSAGGLLAEGAIFEAAYQGLNRQNLFALPDWGRKILMSAATLGAFHIAGKGAEVLNTVIAKNVTKVADGTVRATIQKLLISGNLQAATMLYMGAAEHGLVHGGDFENFNWTEQILHAYAMAGALTISGKVIEVAGKKFVPALKDALAEKPSLERVPTYRRAIQAVRSRIEGLVNTPLGIKIAELKESLKTLRETIRKIMDDAKGKISAIEKRLSTGKTLRPGEKQVLLNQIAGIRDAAKQRADALKEDAKGLDARIKEMEGNLAKEREALEEKLARLEGQLKALEARVLDSNVEVKNLDKSDRIARDLVSGKFNEGIQAIENSKGFPLSANQVLAILSKLHYSQRLTFLNLCKRKMTTAEKDTVLNEIQTADMKASDVPEDFVTGETPVEGPPKGPRESSMALDIDWGRLRAWRAYLVAALAAVSIGEAVAGKDSAVDSRPAAVRFEAGLAERGGDFKSGGRFYVPKDVAAEAPSKGAKNLVFEVEETIGKSSVRELTESQGDILGISQAQIFNNLRNAGIDIAIVDHAEDEYNQFPPELTKYIRVFFSIDGNKITQHIAINQEGLKAEFDQFRKQFESGFASNMQILKDEGFLDKIPKIPTDGQKRADFGLSTLLLGLWMLAKASYKEGKEVGPSILDKIPPHLRHLAPTIITAIWYIVGGIVDYGLWSGDREFDATFYPHKFGIEVLGVNLTNTWPLDILTVWQAIAFWKWKFGKRPPLAPGVDGQNAVPTVPTKKLENLAEFPANGEDMTGFLGTQPAGFPTELNQVAMDIREAWKEKYNRLRDLFLNDLKFKETELKNAEKAFESLAKLARTNLIISECERLIKGGGLTGDVEQQLHIIKERALREQAALMRDVLMTNNILNGALGEMTPQVGVRFAILLSDIFLEHLRGRIYSSDALKQALSAKDREYKDNGKSRGERKTLLGDYERQWKADNGKLSDKEFKEAKNAFAEIMNILARNPNAIDMLMNVQILMNKIKAIEADYNNAIAVQVPNRTLAQEAVIGLHQNLTDEMNILRNKLNGFDKKFTSPGSRKAFWIVLGLLAAGGAGAGIWYNATHQEPKPGPVKTEGEKDAKELEEKIHENDRAKYEEQNGQVFQHQDVQRVQPADPGLPTFESRDVPEPPDNPDTPTPDGSKDKSDPDYY